MIEYRKKVTSVTEEYAAINTDVFHGPPHKGFVLYLAEPIPFLATTTRKGFKAAMLFPRYEVQDYEPVLLSKEGWEKIDEEEYKNTLNQVLESM